MSDELEHRIRELICERIEIDEPPEEISFDQPLFEGAPGALGLDSIEALEIVIGIEEAFGVRIEAEGDDIQEKFYSIRTLAAFVEELKARQVA